MARLTRCVDSKVDFAGIRLRLTTSGLDEGAFLTIPAGESVKTLIDAGELHDLSEGGDCRYSLHAVSGSPFSSEMSILDTAFPFPVLQSRP